jgi:hypothetical protein
MVKEKAILFGPVISELGWEILRFSALIPYYKKHYPDHKFIIFTRPDRFDLYGEYSDILVPLKIEGDGAKYKPDCYRLIGFPKEEYKKLASRFYNQFSKKFDIINHIYPNIDGKNFANKNQYTQKQMKFKWKPRTANYDAIQEYLPSDKKIIILAPRYRSGLRRNWPHWEKLYDLIYSSDLYKKYSFVICGKLPDYIIDSKNRFYDINRIKITSNISTIGLTIEAIKRSILTVGSQSGIPNLAMMLGVPVLEWGHQRQLHESTYNIKKTKIYFLDDMKYNIDPFIIFNKMKEILK